MTQEPLTFQGSSKIAGSTSRLSDPKGSPRFAAVFALAISSALVLVSGSVAQESPASTESARAEIETADLRLAQAVTDNDPDSFRALLAADVVFLGAGGEMKGPDAVLEAWSVFFDPDSGLDLVWSPKIVQVAESGHLGVSSGDYKLTQLDPEGTESASTGRYVTVWERNDRGEWRVVADGNLTGGEWSDPGAAHGFPAALVELWPLTPAPNAESSLHWTPTVLRAGSTDDLMITVGTYEIRVSGDDEQKSLSGSRFVVWDRTEPGVCRILAESSSPPRPAE